MMLLLRTTSSISLLNSSKHSFSQSWQFTRFSDASCRGATNSVAISSSQVHYSLLPSLCMGLLSLPCKSIAYSSFKWVFAFEVRSKYLARRPLLTSIYCSHSFSFRFLDSRRGRSESQRTRELNKLSGLIGFRTGRPNQFGSSSVRFGFGSVRPVTESTELFPKW